MVKIFALHIEDPELKITNTTKRKKQTKKRVGNYTEKVVESKKISKPALLRTDRKVHHRPPEEGLLYTRSREKQV